MARGCSPQVLLPGIAIFALYLSSRYSFLLFHSLVELFRVVILYGVFVLAWHGRRWSANGYLLVVGIASLYIGALEMLHTLAYKGVGIFDGFDANLPTQLWIAFRYLEAFALLIAALLVPRRPNPYVLLGLFAASTVALAYTIFSGRFPDCFIEGQGLTAFKIQSEYALIGLLLAGLGLLWQRRAHFEPGVLRLVAGSIVAGALAEFAFTRYASVYGRANEIGHYALLLSGMLLYRAVLVTGITCPFDLMFRELKAKESELEQRVAERTAALIESEARARAFAENSPSVIYLKDLAGRHTLVNEAFERLVHRTRSEIDGRTVFDLFPATSAAEFDRNDREILGQRKAQVVIEALEDSGGRRIFESIKFPIVDETGAITGVGGISTDITESFIAEQRYATIIRASIDAFVVLDTEGRFVEVNDAACSLTGYERSALLAMGVPDVEAQMDPDAIRLTMQRVQQRGSARFETRWKVCSGAVRDVEVSIQCVGENGQSRLFAFVRDVTERKAAVARIDYLAHHDVLTGLPNRLLFERMFAAHIAQAGGSHAALLLCDLDNFKIINDTLGHVVGDALLAVVAQRLRQCVGNEGLVCRSGGDEFLILPAASGAPAAPVEAIARILREMTAPFHVEEHELVTTVSVGIALYPRDGSDFETLFKKADTAMFQAKEAGRNTYRYFDPAMYADAGERLELLGQLRGAIERQELVLHYQPQIDLQSGRVVGAEALIRWQHPTRGLVPPGRFIPLAEDSGLIVSIGAWVLREACRQAVAWKDEGLSRLVVAVNLSAVQFRDGDLYGTVVDALAESGLDTACLELELTESILIRDAEGILEIVRRLKSLGLKLSIDDFGTGYSSLAYLKRFAVDKLKIDQSFVRDMANDAEDAALVFAIIQMARSLGLKTIAEGVEDAAVMERLKAYACDEVQGFHFARPLPAPEFLAFVRRTEGAPAAQTVPVS
ncbi:MAG TPA: EAL domain-containing protein [Aromatoleum sp.]|uniref:bifunctional diguanylate cyclase/phosphodiesterase n=1 Tax=Aromatoleum sp. TaxID=2307007 RepID=UPI002B4754CD|nr:EAL domain-containing protein [Aromatoleum sp.]HJV24986.1 EAL domain-containing protein [Aromatoleum sp.]